MKKYIILGVLAFALVFVTTPAKAYPVVGSVDVIRVGIATQ